MKIPDLSLKPKLILDYPRIPVKESWTLENLTKSEITRLTHSYHRYPSKFIPQLANRILIENSEPGQLVLDPFAGSGTTLVEGMLGTRRVIGIDVNPISEIICRAKTTPIDPKLLNNQLNSLKKRLNKYNKRSDHRFIISTLTFWDLNVEKARFWFREDVLEKLSILLYSIGEEENAEIRTFFKCGFSHILKSCSKWLMNSVKPQIDPLKIPAEPFNTFEKHITHMARKNLEFFHRLPLYVKHNMRQYFRFYREDCRNVDRLCGKDISIILTSPPYATSYEYSYVHQLSTLWLEPTLDPTEYKKRFIGSKSRTRSDVELQSILGKKIVYQLEQKARNLRVPKAVHAYFIDLQETIAKFRKVLLPEGKVCFVIGDTTLYGVNVYNAGVIHELCLNSGFETDFVIKRRIPLKGKFLPSQRDPSTGVFKPRSLDMRIAYPHELILLMKNPS